MSRRYVEDDSRLHIATASRAILRRGYSLEDFKADATAGVVVGVVALPLAMALAIAAGVSPEFGLFTAIVAGIVAALTGGSMHSISGPTAAFVVLLVPVTAKHGLSGLLVATFLAGIILVLMGALRLGKLIQFVPHPVTTGFTTGIAVVIAVLQLGDLVGIGRLEGEKIWTRLLYLGEHLPDMKWQDLGVGLATIGLLVLMPKISAKVPGALVGLVVATLIGVVLGRLGFEVATVNSQFGGIPAVPPTPRLPWGGAGFSLAMIEDLMPTAFAIALLGAIETLLCSVVADGMAGGRHDSDSELMGLGIANLVAPFFGGFAATGAIARTAAGIRAGGRTPITAVVHSLFILVAMLALAPVLGYLPMAAMAALLLTVAWNMSEFRHFMRITRIAPRGDVAVMLVCFGLTVLYDMVIAVGIGVVLAALLFMRRMVEISGARIVGGPEGHPAGGLPPGVLFYDIAGPLFFGAAEKALGSFAAIDRNIHTVIVDLEDVPAVDATGLVALESIVTELNGQGIKVVLAGVNPQPKRALAKAGFVDRSGELEITDDTESTVNFFHQ